MRKLLASNALLALAVVVAVLIGLPVASVLANIFSGGTSGVWRYLASRPFSLTTLGAHSGCVLEWVWE